MMILPRLLSLAKVPLFLAAKVKVHQIVCIEKGKPIFLPKYLQYILYSNLRVHLNTNSYDIAQVSGKSLTKIEVTINAELLLTLSVSLILSTQVPKYYVIVLGSDPNKTKLVQMSLFYTYRILCTSPNALHITTNVKREKQQGVTTLECGSLAE